MFGSAQPSGHADPLELADGRVQVWTRLSVTFRAGEHQRLVEVGDRPKRACLLLLQDQARLCALDDRLDEAGHWFAQAGKRQPQIHHGESEVGGERLESQGSLDRL